VSFQPVRYDPGALRRDSPKMLPCRTVGCKNLRGTAKLVCMSCWWSIPQALRVTVSEAWREYLRITSVANFEKYKEARKQALEAAAQKVRA